MTFTLEVANRGESEVFNAGNAAGGGVGRATAGREAVEGEGLGVAGGEGKVGVAID